MPAGVGTLVKLVRQIQSSLRLPRTDLKHRVFFTLTCSWASHLSASESDLSSSWEEAPFFFRHWALVTGQVQAGPPNIDLLLTNTCVHSQPYIHQAPSQPPTHSTVSFFRTICTPILFVFVCYWPIIVLQTTLLCGWSLAKKSCQSPQTWDA